MKKNVIAIAVAFLFVFLVYTTAELSIPLPFGNKPMEFEIKRGSTFRQAVDSLAQRGFVRDKWIFFLFGRITGIDRKIKAGYYSLWGTMTPLEIFNAIRLGKIIEYEITVVPGDSLMEVGQKFSALSLVEGEEFQRLITNGEFLDSLDVDAPSLEGYLFPETYRFPKGLEVKEALSIMVNRLREKFDDDMILRTMELGLTERDVLTMASIVEKETNQNDEKPDVAGVYMNRLKDGWLLQADPTLVYALGDFSIKRVLNVYKTIDSPYNTYKYVGLPPGPICLPSISSIDAVLNYRQHKYMYFCAREDFSGYHNFAVTMEEHLLNAAKYQQALNQKGIMK